MEGDNGFFVPNVYEIEKKETIFSIQSNFFLILHSFRNKWKQLIFYLVPSYNTEKKNFVKREKNI